MALTPYPREAPPSTPPADLTMAANALGEVTTGFSDDDLEKHGEQVSGPSTPVNPLKSDENTLKYTQ